MEYLTTRITIDSDICNGKPTIRGQRISVHSILEYLAMGDTIEEILIHFPTLDKEDVYECLAFASKIIDTGLMIKKFAA